MKTTCMVFLFVLAAFSTSSLFAQSSDFELTVPRPVFGWDSLQQSIRYPEIAKRAGIQGLFYVTVLVDSVGNVRSVEDTSLVEILRSPVEHAIRSTKWFSGFNKKNTSVTATVRIPIYFFFENFGPQPLLIRGRCDPQKPVTN